MTDLTPREQLIRNRTVKGWVVRTLSKEEIEAIKAYLAGGPTPPGYEKLEQTVRGQFK